MYKPNGQGFGIGIVVHLVVFDGQCSGIGCEKLPLDRKSHQRKWAITTTFDQFFCPFRRAKISFKCFGRQQFAPTCYTLLGVCVVVDNNLVVEDILITYRPNIQSGRQSDNHQRRNKMKPPKSAESVRQKRLKHTCHSTRRGLFRLVCRLRACRRCGSFCHTKGTVAMLNKGVKMKGLGAFARSLISVAP